MPSYFTGNYALFFPVASREIASLANKSAAILRAMSANPTIVLSGPSGSGKSTLLTKAMQQFPGKFAFGVSRKFL